jgi:ATP synthase protein I
MGPSGVLSAFMGGMTAAVPTLCFARIVFHSARASAAKQIMRRVYRGEAFKIILSILLFVLSFGCLNITPVVFFVVYFVVQLTYWVTPWVFVGK